MNNFLKYFCISFLIFLSGRITAQSADSLYFVDFSFEAEYSSASIKGDANKEFQGKAYHAEGIGIESFCDGIDIWTIDHKTKEVYIESLSEETESYMLDMAEQLIALKDGTSASFELPDGSMLDLKIHGIKKSGKKDLNSFRPNKFDSSWIVVDLR